MSRIMRNILDMNIYKYKDTPLHLAVSTGILEIIKVLIEVGGADTKLINFAPHLY